VQFRRWRRITSQSHNGNTENDAKDVSHDDLHAAWWSSAIRLKVIETLTDKMHWEIYTMSYVLFVVGSN